MGVVGNNWFDPALLSVLHRFKPSCWPMLQLPSFDQLFLSNATILKHEWHSNIYIHQFASILSALEVRLIPAVDIICINIMRLNIQEHPKDGKLSMWTGRTLAAPCLEVFDCLEIWMHIYIYIYTHTYTYVYIYMYICIHLYLSLYIWRVLISFSSARRARPGCMKIHRTYDWNNNTIKTYVCIYIYIYM